MRSVALSLLSAMVLFMAAGCSEEVNVQDKFTGLWTLENRKMPDGKTIQSPQISGWFEWSVMDQTRGHATFALSSGENNIQFVGAVYTISGNAFTREVYVQIGGGYRSVSEAGYDAKAKTDQGQIDADRAVLTHADGVTLTFEGEKLTVTLGDGTVDTWKKAG